MLRTTLFLMLGVLLWTAGSASAQEAGSLVRRHRYTEAIRTILQPGVRVEGLDEAALSALAVAHLQRGYLLRDLAALQVDVGARYYAARRAEAEEATVPWATYFLGRSVFSQGAYDEALTHFEAVADAPRLPPAYRRRARLWAAACHALAGRSDRADALWDAVSVANDPALAGERALARWAAGRPEVPVCDASPDALIAVTRCRLWAAVRTQDVAALYPLQARLLAAEAPDQEVLAGLTVSLRFYDPSTLDVLAAADFTAAMDAFGRLAAGRQRREALLFAGLSAYEAGLYEAAHALLQQTDHPLRSVYLGALTYRSGDRDLAAQLWSQVRAADAASTVEWAAAASRFDAEHAAIREAARRLQRTASGDQRLARKLGRALLQAGQPPEALRLLEAAYPFAYDNQLDRIEPAYLATLAHARFLAGRTVYPAVRGHLAALAAAYPVAEGVLYLMQAYTLPERRASLNKRTGH